MVAGIPVLNNRRNNETKPYKKKKNTTNNIKSYLIKTKQWLKKKSLSLVMVTRQQHT